jgi:hypothetical protein
MKKIIWATGRNYRSRALFGEKKKKRLDLHARLPNVPFVTYADNESYARRWLLLLAQGFKTMN